MKAEMNSRGNQADDRKYRQPSCTSGAWNGVLLHTDTPFPMKATTQKKWSRFRDGLDWVVRQANDTGKMDTAELRRIAGLGVNVTVRSCDIHNNTAKKNVRWYVILCLLIFYSIQKICHNSNILSY